MPYKGYFGGVSAMSTNDFKKVNGFSNKFWGWGGEDDDMRQRIKSAGLGKKNLTLNTKSFEFTQYITLIR